jgi:UDP-N-acetylmuramoyl-L-alanyl-D-glutamate--2,6-diaminopimelate ligase
VLLSKFLNSDIFAKIGYIETIGAGDPDVAALEYDSRKVGEGSLYFALAGLHADGHAFIGEAVKRGAVAVVCQNELAEYRAGVVYVRVKDSRFAISAVADAFYGHPSQKLAVIGVTGTEGKSTTVYLIWQLLRLLGKKAGFVSTVQYCVDEDEQANPEHQTTPEATAVHKKLAEMVANGLEFAVLESSSHGLSPRTNRLGDVAFDVGVMTNVTHEHLEFHGTWERYRDDKANLFRALDKTGHVKQLCTGQAAQAVRAAQQAPRVPSFGVANADDKSAAYFADATKQPVFFYSAKIAGAVQPSSESGAKTADLSLLDIEPGAGGNRYMVRVRHGLGGTGKMNEAGLSEAGTRKAASETAPAETLAIQDNLPGAFNAANVLAGLLVVSGLLGLPVEIVAAQVPRLKPVRGRMTAVQKGQDFEVLVDYAHTPSSFEAIFPPLRERLDKTGGRIISLFGSAGERDTQKRPEQGRIAAQWSDIVILSDEDPRGEVPMAILEEIAAGIPGGIAAPVPVCETSTAPAGKTADASPNNRVFVRGETLFLIPDRPAAIQKAISLARKGDLVLLLGKGHENSNIYARETRPYDEIAEAEKALETLLSGA